MMRKMNTSFSLFIFTGRINIVDLQQVCLSVCEDRALVSSPSSSYISPPVCWQIINVDWVHVESRASDIAKSDKGVQMVLGQLIDE